MNSTQRDAGPCRSDFSAYFVYRDVERHGTKPAPRLAFAGRGVCGL